MIDYITIAVNFGLPGAGCFLGTSAAFYAWCPNRRCCQQKRINALCEAVKKDME